jgi:hypothetical protein
MFQDTQSVSVFPNPPVYVNGRVTVTLSPAGGSLSFDTGSIPLTWNAGAQVYNAYHAYLGDIPVSGSWSVTTGGETYTGSFTGLISEANAAAFTSVSLVNYPLSVTLSMFNPVGAYLHAAAMSGETQVTATNGFDLNLSFICNAAWAMPDCGNFATLVRSVTATNVAAGAASITTQPQSVVVYAYDTASFTAAASGTVPLSYQWSFDGTNIVGATSSSLTISNVTQRNLGAYAVTITNAFGSVASSNATLSMYPYIETPFLGAITYWGKNATFSIQAWGTGPLRYQWFDNGVAILNATNQTLTLTSTQFTDAGLYSVLVSSPLGSVTNTAEQVVVNPAGVSLGMYPGLTVTGTVGYTYIIQATSDLSNTNSWTTVESLTLVEPIQLWVDTTVNVLSPANPHKYYRVLPGG